MSDGLSTHPCGTPLSNQNEWDREREKELEVKNKTKDNKT